MTPLIFFPSGGSQQNEAIKHASIAYYKQSGIEKHVKRIEKESIPEEVKDISVVVTWGVTVYDTKMITYGWEF